MTQTDPLAAHVHEHAVRAAQILARLDSAPALDLDRTADNQSVHDLRTSLRRLRAALRSFDTSFTGAASLVSPSGDRDLRFVARTLSELRDRDVLAEGLLADVEPLSGPLVTAPLRDVLVTALGMRRHRALEHVLRRRGTARWRRAVDQLDAWRISPPALSDREQLLPLLESARSEVRERLETAHGDLHALHSARKAAKRWRYAAEALLSAVPAAAGHYEAATEVHEHLGRMQDAVVAAEFLDALGRDVALGDGALGDAVLSEGTARDLRLLRGHVQERIDEIVGQVPRLL